MLNLVADSEVVIPKPKQTMLPVLIVLFLLSYGLMTMLIVEQGRTIDTQRFLIRQLFNDSTQLSAMKGAEGQKQNQAKARARAQNPAQAAPAEKPKNSHNTTKLQQTAPLKPPKAASDTADERRSLVTI